MKQRAHLKFLAISGSVHAGLAAKIVEVAKLHDIDVMVLEFNSAGGNIGDSNEVESFNENVDRLAKSTAKSSEMIMKISELQHKEYFKPKKIHPKHQRNNKYRK